MVDTAAIVRLNLDIWFSFKYSVLGYFYRPLTISVCDFSEPLPLQCPLTATPSIIKFDIIF